MFVDDNTQVLGITLEEGSDYVLVGFPSKIVVGNDGLGNQKAIVSPYTNLPYLKIYKYTLRSPVPLHAEAEFLYYEYLINKILIHNDAKKLLQRYGYCPDISTDFYLERAEYSRNKFENNPFLLDEPVEEDPGSEEEEEEASNDRTLH